MKRALMLLLAITASAGAADLPAAAWMGRLDPSTKISRLTIPGTHNSAARFEPLAGTAKCQESTLTAQLEMGVRFLDLRCRHTGDRFSLYHGSVDQRLGFDAAIAEITGFLAAHPTECVLVSIKEEHTASGNSRSFAQTFDDYAAKTPAQWWLAGHLPTIAEARGRMVLIRRFAAAGKTGIDATHWPDNTSFENAMMVVQDCYQVADPAVKWKRVEDALAAAARGADEDRLRLDFASGYRPGMLGIPNIGAVAGSVNPRLNAWFASAAAGTYGCVIMDFARPPLCASILRTNFPPPASATPGAAINHPSTP